VIFSHLKSPVKTQSFLRFKTEIDTAISLYYYPFELGENRKFWLVVLQTFSGINNGNPKVVLSQNFYGINQAFVWI